METAVQIHVVRLFADQDGSQSTVATHTGYPMEIVAMDLTGPYAESSEGNRYILVVGDTSLSGWKCMLYLTRKPTR